MNREAFEEWLKQSEYRVLLDCAEWNEDKQRYTSMSQANFAYQAWCAAMKWMQSNDSKESV